jgi:hypothetical protein
MSRNGCSDGHWQAAGRYEIRIKGHLDTRWAAWFDGLSLIHQGEGTTVIHGPVVDQAALHGVLRKIGDLGLPLLSVNQVEPNQPNVSTNQPRQASQEKGTPT